MPSIANNPKLKILNHGNILHALADALVIPQTAEGDVEIQFRSFIDQLGFYPGKNNLLGDVDPRGVIGQPSAFKYVIYATIENGTGSSYSIVREIAIKIAKFAESTPDIQVVACTALGSNELNGLDCIKIIAKGFSETSNKELHIHTSNAVLVDDGDHINISEFQSSSSLKYAFRASVIKSVRYTSLQSILNSSDFYYELAKDKFKEFERFAPVHIDFFAEVFENYTRVWRDKGATFTRILDRLNPESNDFLFLKLAGELVAYIGLNGPNKNEWNAYSDKRVIGTSSVKHFDWICNLIQFRKDGNKLDNIVDDVANAIRFFQKPARRLSMLSDQHRSYLLKNIYGDDYNTDADLEIIFNQFELWGIKANNPVNKGALYTQILYLDEIGPLWNWDPNEQNNDDNTLFPGNLESVGASVHETGVRRSIEPAFLTDYYADVDLLNYDLYAAAIVAFIKHKNTKAPLTIGIMAPWGKGKTSLMRFIKKKLDAINPLPPKSSDSPEKKAGPNTVNFQIFRSWLNTAKNEFKYDKTLQFPTVWFNAWKFQRNEQIWAGLAHEIIHQLADQLPNQLAREQFWLRLNLKRVDQEKLKNKLFFKIVNKILKSIIAGSLAIIGIIISLFLHPSLLLSLITYCGLPTFATIYFVYSRLKVEKEKIDLDIEKYVREPEYAAKRGYFHEVESDLRDAMNMLVADNLPAVLFIDDLDRCSPNTVSEVVEAINLFISGDFPKCYFVLGQDAQMVAASLDVAFEKITSNPSNLYREQGSLGWHFMEKFIQLQFCIPTLNEDQAKTFFKKFFHQKTAIVEENSVLLKRISEFEEKIKSDSKVSEILTPETSELEDELKGIDQLKAIQIQEKIIEKAAAEFDDNDPEVLTLIDLLSPFVGTSPRAIKRFINLYRFYTFLQLTNRNNRQLETSSTHLGQWAIIMIRWPQLVRAIQWQASGDFIKGSTALDRSQSFEKMIFQYASFNEWTEVVNNTAPTLTWLKDRELYQFMRFMKKNNNSLDNAVLTGLW